MVFGIYITFYRCKGVKRRGLGSMRWMGFIWTDGDECALSLSLSTYFFCWGLLVWGLEGVCMFGNVLLGFI